MQHKNFGKAFYQNMAIKIRKKRIAKKQRILFGCYDMLFCGCDDKVFTFRLCLCVYFVDEKNVYTKLSV